MQGFHWLYLALNIFTLSYPLFRSFEKRVHYFRYWKALFPGILVMCLVFIPWDIWFTQAGVWRFNHDYVLGVFIFSLPLEEWLFFLTTPFACFFIYEVLRYFFPRWEKVKVPTVVIISIVLIFLAISIYNHERLYTFVNFFVASISTFVFYLVHKQRNFFLFLMCYFVSIIPFALVNGVLTGMPVLIYNNLENLSIRVGTIPIEDFFYSYSILLQTVIVFEILKKKQKS